MEQLFNIDFKRINSLNDKEAADRKKNFELFLKGGLPNKKNENWKFSDLNYIISKNFKNITNNDEYTFDEKIETIHDFDHNKVILVNGSLKSCDLHFEEKGKVKIETLKSLERLLIISQKIILIILIKLCQLVGFIWKFNKTTNVKNQ